MPATVASWIAYAAERGRVVENDTASAAALVRASDYIRLRYLARMVEPDTDDTTVIEATHIAAGYELTTPGFWTTTYTPSQIKVLTKVGDISWTPLSGSARGPEAMLPVSPAIEALLRPLVACGLPAMLVV